MGWRVAIGYDAAIPEQSVSRSWTGWEDPWAATRPTATATAPQTWVALDRMASFLARALETRPGSTGYPAHTVASLLRLGNRPDRLGQRMHGSYRGPMSAGYSGTPLVRKLGIKEGYRVGVVADPGHLAALVDPLPADARLINNPRLPCPLLNAFAPDRRRFDRVFPRLVGRLPAHRRPVDRLAKEVISPACRPHRRRDPRRCPSPGAGRQQGVRHRLRLERSPLGGAQGEPKNVAFPVAVDHCGPGWDGA